MSYSVSRTVLTRAACGLAAMGVAAALTCGVTARASEAQAGAGTAEAQTGATGSQAGKEASATVWASEAQEGATTLADARAAINAADMFTDRDLAGTYDDATATHVALADCTASVTDAAGSSAVSVDGGTVTITDEGTYVLSGTLEGGRVVVAAEDTDKVQIVLAGATVNNDNGVALLVTQADKVFVTLAEGTQNTLVATGTIEDAGSNADACVFSKADLVLNGTGSLAVTSADGHGVVTKDDLKVTGGTISVDAAGHALSGKDSVRVAGGELTLVAGKNGLDADNGEDAAKGYVYVEGGTVAVTSGNDAVHASGSAWVAGGTLTLSAADDGAHADAALLVSAGTLEVTQSTEGLEGQTITLESGDVSVTASDDGLNASGGSSGAESAQSEAPAGVGGEQVAGTPATPGDADVTGSGGNGSGGPGVGSDGPGSGDPATQGSSGGPSRQGGDGGPGGGMGYDSACLVTISGGTLTITAGGDGIDSNGDLVMTGGTVYVNGPTSGGDGALDYGGSASISGGVIVAVGASGMAEGFGSDSTQGTALVNLASSIEGDVTLTDADGTVLASFSPSEAYSSVVVSCPDMVEGGTYALTCGSETTTLEMTSLVVTSGTAGAGMGGMGGGPGGQSGGIGGPGGPGGQGSPADMGVGAGMGGQGGSSGQSQPAGASVQANTGAQRSTGADAGASGQQASEADAAASGTAA